MKKLLIIIIVLIVVFTCVLYYLKNFYKGEEIIDSQINEVEETNNEIEEINYEIEEDSNKQLVKTADKKITASGFAGASNSTIILKDGNMYLYSEQENELRQVAIGVGDIYKIDNNETIFAFRGEGFKIISERPVFIEYVDEIYNTETDMIIGTADKKIKAIDNTDEIDNVIALKKNVLYLYRMQTDELITLATGVEDIYFDQDNEKIFALKGENFFETNEKPSFLEYSEKEI